MDATTRIEQALTAAIDTVVVPGCPPRLAAAVRHAVFPGGARVRPRLCLAVAAACGKPDDAAADAAAVAIELLHCASLVHDDLPCFDDSPLRRGLPSVHCAFGEPLAVLAGDALIILAFEHLARVLADSPERLAPLLLTIGRSVGMPYGITAGQAWECEPQVSVADYHRAKTGSLFTAATAAGALVAGADAAAWSIVGDKIGEAYQVADDLRDVAASAQEVGKPVGRDAVLNRPSAAGELGIDGAIARLRDLVKEAIDAIPACAGRDQFAEVLMAESRRILPKDLTQRVA
ncbi:polyprenyl synthetase family protein [Thermochromatium tepidum]|uniref:Geranylgeranyl pyrophosphate synthase n=1 Tax=Thermochromatium tepidum ATCC 43061 TaxID=316276 RepID=A0A6I6DYH8_THETI|nr:polyprenyl synthetase family protein [Thermochromatium tepidum]QGU31815.1 geranylgeranyl pyrophosphate synthase [Thermochromatium tepidum ATCC 43061]